MIGKQRLKACPYRFTASAVPETRAAMYSNALFTVTCVGQLISEMDFVSGITSLFEQGLILESKKHDCIKALKIQIDNQMSI